MGVVGACQEVGGPRPGNLKLFGNIFVIGLDVEKWVSNFIGAELLLGSVETVELHSSFTFTSWEKFGHRNFLSSPSGRFVVFHQFSLYIFKPVPPFWDLIDLIEMKCSKDVKGVAA
jgi:hypothetical protein